VIKENNPLILDCRDVKNYQAGHLDNALHVHEGLKESLIKRGEDVYSLEGGYSAWQEQQSNQ
jgi:thiosulfate sulfurtransferase